MQIPNYDFNEDEYTNFKQLYPYMPKSSFRMLICGNSGSGKTNLLYHILMRPLVYYDQIHLYGKHLEQEKYRHMIKELNDFSNEVGYDIISYSNDEITLVTRRIDPNSQTIVISDDFVREKNKKLVDYFMQGRNKNCSGFHYSTPKDTRLNCTHYILYERPNKNEISRICNELAVTKDQYIKATKKPHSFLCIDKPMKRVKRNF